MWWLLAAAAVAVGLATVGLADPALEAPASCLALYEHKLERWLERKAVRVIAVDAGSFAGNKKKA